MRVNYETKREIKDVIVSAALANSRGVVVFESYSHRECEPTDLAVGKGSVFLDIERLSLRPDVYFLSVTMSEADLMNKLEWHDRCYSVTVKSSGQPVNQGLIYPHPDWRFEHRS